MTTQLVPDDFMSFLAVFGADEISCFFVDDSKNNVIQQISYFIAPYLNSPF